MNPLASSYETAGFLKSLGVRLCHSQPGRVLGELIVEPDHLNRAGGVHGGVLCSMIDFAACGAGLHTEPDQHLRLGVTLSLSVQFTRPAVGGRLEVEGKVTSSGHKTYTSEASVRDGENRLVAHGIGTFQWRNGSEPSALSAI
jgi:uncharacterized protein (TIGR00369 family)